MANQKDWWFLDQDGRKIGYLWPEDFVSLLMSHYGKSWVADFAELSGLTAPSIYRYRDGIQPVPKQTAMLIMALGTLKARGITLEEPVCEWLPDSTPDTAYEDSKMA